MEIASVFFCLLVLPLFFPSISSASTSSPLSLVSHIPYPDLNSSLQRVTHIASTARARAHHLKNLHHRPISKAALFPFAGVYSVVVGLGTPLQRLPMLVDTGSSFSWIPCTRRYVCRNCSASSSSSFIPRESSSAKIVGCMNVKCGWIHESSDSKTSCRDCKSTGKNCTEICPPYLILYGSGYTGGVAMVDTLTISDKVVKDFLVGCSVFAANLPAGVAGFGRGNASLPRQLGLKKFSYCLVSHELERTFTSSRSLLLMDSESNTGEKTPNLSYTPLLRNPIEAGKSPLKEYYYVGLKKITVSGRKANVPDEHLSPDSNGNGGTIVDSGSTFTYMNRAVFDSVSKVFAEQMKRYKRTGDIESVTGLRPCLEGVGRNGTEMPELKLHFKGGAKMKLPLNNYLVSVSDDRREATCLAIVSDKSPTGPETATGPAVILGNLFMQNFYIEFDLRNERFGFGPQSCS